MIMRLLQVNHRVMIGGQAEEAAIRGCDLAELSDRLANAAAKVQLNGGRVAVEALGVRLEVTRDDDPDAPTSFQGPPTLSDPIARMVKRIWQKAKQTIGGPPAWIRIDEQGGLFQLSPWAHSPIEQRLAELCAALTEAIESYPHIRGLVLTDGTYPWGSQDTDVTCGRRGQQPLAGPVALLRKLPLQRSRRTFVLPNGVRRVELPPHLELSPARWYAEEGSWLDWALRDAGWPSLDRCLPRE